MPHKTNRECLDLPKSFLTPLEQQRQFLLQRMLRAMRCPNRGCNRLVNEIEAMGLHDINEYDWDRPNPKFACPFCHYELTSITTLYGQRFWMISEPLPPKTVTA